MKAKKILVVLLVAAFLVIGWGVALRKPEVVDYAAQQSSLVKEADGFVERGLYLRAIPLYEEAASLPGDETLINSIEDKLMNIYLEDNDTDKFFSRETMLRNNQLQYRFRRKQKQDL